eukprot:TRINITY_DN7805_c0_g1_i4.p1 TRINITY_DN7805_c0_g1~~TRINITY_DN7805_c0_g1_i4.p1  ORF type:complete len:420 (+),score=89.83 TRINITY_DN7805_c0_g1_i4:88-1260(+)
MCIRDRYMGKAFSRIFEPTNPRFICGSTKSMEKANSPVLVTGASGFIAAHVIRELLEKGYRVRGTVRDPNNKKKTEPIYQIYPEKRDLIELVQADLLDSQETWEKVVAGCEYIMHVASPFPLKAPRHEDDLIKPALEGTLKVVKAGVTNGVKKVIVTSSIAAIMDVDAGKRHNEDDWAFPDRIPPYEKSKALAERALWKVNNRTFQLNPISLQFWEANKDKIQIATINPGLVTGPTFTTTPFSSGEIFSRILNHNVPAIIDMQWACVDVRNVAQAHVAALENENSNGKRYILVENSYMFEDWVNTLRKEFDPQGWSLVKRKIGRCPLKLVSWFDEDAKSALFYIGKRAWFDNSRSIRELGIQYIAIDKSIVDMAYSLIERGFVKDRRKKK